MIRRNADLELLFQYFDGDFQQTVPLPTISQRLQFQIPYTDFELSTNFIIPGEEMVFDATNVEFWALRCIEASDYLLCRWNSGASLNREPLYPGQFLVLPQGIAGQLVVSPATNLDPNATGKFNSLILRNAP